MRTREDRVVAHAARDAVVVEAALQQVVAGAAIDGVVAGPAEDRVIAVTAGNGVGADHAINEIIACAAIDGIVSGSGGVGKVMQRDRHVEHVGAGVWKHIVEKLLDPDVVETCRWRCVGQEGVIVAGTAATAGASCGIAVESDLVES